MSSGLLHVTCNRPDEWPYRSFLWSLAFEIEWPFWFFSAFFLYIFDIFIFFFVLDFWLSVITFCYFYDMLFCELIIELSFHEYYILYSFQFFQLKKIKHSLARLNSVLSICSNSIFLFCYCTTNIFQCMFNISHEINTKTSTISAFIS